MRAQDVPPGLQASFDFTQGLEFSDNPDLEANGESEIFGRTVLGFGLESVTKTQQFALNLGTNITTGRDDSSDIDLEVPFISFAYNRASQSAEFGLDFSYREADVGGAVDQLVFDEDGNVITQTGGTRQFLFFSLDGAVGRGAPIGASWSWQHSDLSYSGTTDPSLTDQNTNRVSGQVDFRINPSLTVSLTGRYSDFDTEGNGVDRETTALGLAAGLQVSQVTTANLGLSYERIERSGNETGTDDGLSFNASMQRDLRDGSWGLNFATNVRSNVDGRRSTLTVRRQMELPRGTLGYALGFTHTDATGVDPLVNLDYLHTLPDGRFTVGLAQSVVSDDNNNERVNTSLRLGYDRQINSSSSFGVNLTVFDVNNLSTAAVDSQRADLSLTYRHDLNRDWDLFGSFTHARLREDNVADRNRNTVFVGVQRSFTWNP